MLILPNNVMIELSNLSKKIMEPLNVTKVWSYVMILPNMIMKLFNVCKKIIKPPNVTKVQSYVILLLCNVTIESSNVSKK